MIDVSNRNIWFFRERRSGGTPLTFILPGLLNRQPLFIDDNSDFEPYHDPSIFYNTHDFELLHKVQHLNPILFRCTRKNKTEQMLSERAAFRMDVDSNDEQFFNFSHNVEEELTNFIKFTHNKIRIGEQSVRNFAERKKRLDQLWDSVSSKFENHTFYYEDVSDTIDIPILNLYNVEINRDKFTKKLPNYKRKVYTNYDQVEQWMNNYYL